MKITFREENIFVPEFEGNDKLPESEQIKVYWNYPNSAEAQDIRGFRNPRMTISGKKAKKKADEAMEVEVFVDSILAVKKLVYKIENLEVNGQRIETGEVLTLTKGMAALVSEISAEILATMDRTKDDLKNS